MRSSRRRPLLLLTSALIAAVPMGFGLIRAVSTGSDFRYLWMAAVSLVAALAVTMLGRTASSDVTVGRALGSVVCAAGCAAVAGALQGARSITSIAIVAVAFGLCSGVGAVLFAVARIPRVRA